MGYIEPIGYILGSYWDNGEEKGNFRNHMGYIGDT